MTRLQTAALGVLPLPTMEVETIYRLRTGDNSDLSRQFRRLCESHERLRAELEGCDEMLSASEAANRKALGFVKYALEFWDWSRFPNLEQSTQELRDVLIGCVGDVSNSCPDSDGHPGR